MLNTIVFQRASLGDIGIGKILKDPFKIIRGCLQSYKLIKKTKPDVIFSAGGFVSVPVAIGAWLNRVPIIIREPDSTLGLANKI